MPSSPALPSGRGRLERRLRNVPTLVWSLVVATVLTTLSFALATVPPIEHNAVEPPAAASQDTAGGAR